MYFKKVKRVYFTRPPRIPVKSLSLSKTVEGFLLACQARRLSKHTIDDYTRTLKRFLSHVGDLPIKDIQSAQVSAFLASQPWKTKTILNYHIGLSALWTWAVREIVKRVLEMVKQGARVT